MGMAQQNPVVIEIIFKRGLAGIIQGAGHPRDGFVACARDQVNAVAVRSVVFFQVQQPVSVRIPQRRAGIQSHRYKQFDRGHFAVFVVFGRHVAAQRIQSVLHLPAVRQAVAVIILRADHGPRARPVRLGAGPPDRAGQPGEFGSRHPRAVIAVLVIEGHVPGFVELGLLQIPRRPFQDPAGDFAAVGSVARADLLHIEGILAGHILEFALAKGPGGQRVGPGVGQQRMQALLAEIGQPVAVRVGIVVERIPHRLGFHDIESPPRPLKRIQQPVAVGVAVQRIGPGGGIQLVVRKMRARLSERRTILAERKIVGLLQFSLGGQSVAVGIHVRMPQGPHLLARCIGHRDRRIHAVVVDEPVLPRVHPRIDFHGVFQPVVIRVGGARVGSGIEFHQVGHAVAVAVEPLGIGAGAEMHDARRHVGGIAGEPAFAAVDGGLPAVPFLLVQEAVAVHVVFAFVARIVFLFAVGVELGPAVGYRIIEISGVKPRIGFRLRGQRGQEQNAREGSPQ